MMQASLGMTLFILLVIVVILFSLFKGLGGVLNKSKSNPDAKPGELDLNKTAKALTFRIGFSLFLFFSILLAYSFGWIKPHGLTLETTKAQQAP